MRYRACTILALVATVGFLASVAQAQPMMGGGMMRMHERVEQRLDALEQMIEQLIEREVAESDAR